VQNDRYFLTAARYVERNALRANQVKRAEDWQWSSLWRRERGSAQERGLMSEWPVPRPKNWLERVNEPQTEKELAALHESARRGRPFGDPVWQAKTAARLKLESTFRPPGRPKKKGEANRRKKVIL
jgi:putative transposase